MTEIDREGRSQKEITRADLQRLELLARKNLDSLFQREPYSAQFRPALRALCLGQGAALHFLDHKNGVKDFDVWCFFEPVEGAKFPYRRVGNEDFGYSEHGRWIGDHASYKGRRVDIMGRDIPMKSRNVFENITRWLETDKNKTPRMLSQKCLIALWPFDQMGKCIWPAADNGQSFNGRPI